MKDWFTLEPDRIRLIFKHFTPGRGGRKIRHVTRHHMGGIGGVDECWNWWQTRQASAHYAVSPTGEIGQLVWDRDTAWANADPVVNAETIAIEHSNSAGPGQDWPINDVTIREGARLAAAICFVHKLGRPVFGVNIRDHCEFTGTECPYHLRAGRRYHDAWMRYAQEHYDWMVAQAANPHPTATPDNQEAHMSAVDIDTNAQLTGSKELGHYPGFPSRRWQHVAQDDGPSFTAVDYLREIDRETNSVFDYRQDPSGDRAPVTTLVGHVLATRRQLDVIQARLDALALA